MRDQQGFDQWSEQYDQDVDRTDASNRYPFAGYQRVHDEIVRRVLDAPGRRVLDLGFGTAALTGRLYEAGCQVWGQDFSPKMTALAQEKMPQARLYQGDLSQALAGELLEQRYDAVIATYSLHHLTDARKLQLLEQLRGLLAPGGRILVGDVAFQTRAQMEQCARDSGEEWDDEEIYFVYDEIKGHFPGCTFLPCSACAGVLEFPAKE